MSSCEEGAPSLWFLALQWAWDPPTVMRQRNRNLLATALAARTIFATTFRQRGAFRNSKTPHRINSPERAHASLCPLPSRYLSSMTATSTASFHQAHYRENPHHAPAPTLCGASVSARMGHGHDRFVCSPCCDESAVLHYTPSRCSRSVDWWGNRCCAGAAAERLPCDPPLPRLHRPCRAVLCAPPLPRYTAAVRHAEPRACGACGACERCATNREWRFYWGVSGVPRSLFRLGCAAPFEPQMHPF